MNRELGSVEQWQAVRHDLQSTVVKHVRTSQRHVLHSHIQRDFGACFPTNSRCCAFHHWRNKAKGARGDARGERETAVRQNESAPLLGIMWMATRSRGHPGTATRLETDLQDTTKWLHLSKSPPPSGLPRIAIRASRPLAPHCGDRWPWAEPVGRGPHLHSHVQQLFPASHGCVQMLAWLTPWQCCPDYITENRATQVHGVGCRTHPGGLIRRPPNGERELRDFSQSIENVSPQQSEKTASQCASCTTAYPSVAGHSHAQNVSARPCAIRAKPETQYPLKEGTVRLGDQSQLSLDVVWMAHEVPRTHHPFTVPDRTSAPDWTPPPRLARRSSSSHSKVRVTDINHSRICTPVPLDLPLPFLCRHNPEQFQMSVVM